MNGRERRAAEPGEQVKVARDAHGNELHDGGAMTVIKGTKLKGSSQVVKGGTKARNIRLVEGDHDIDCRIDGIGAMQLSRNLSRRAKRTTG